MGRKVIINKQKLISAQSRHSTTPVPTSLEKSLFALLIFTIPTNLALGFLKDTAFVNGILVDYLIPKLYLSDIIAIFLITAWFARVKWPQTISNSISWIKNHKNESFGLLAFFISIFISTSLSIKPITSYYYLAKLVEFALVTAWISTNISQIDLGRSITPTLIFQSTVAIIQWVQKKSLLGYLFLGETTLRASSHVAKTSITGEIRPLPYGTTPHPNVLAGFIAIAVLILLISCKDSPYKHISKYIKNPSHTLTLLFSSIILLLTQSVAAIIALLLGLLTIYLGTLSAKSRYIALLVFGTLLSASLFYLTPKLPEESINRRIGLAKISTNMILANPIFGVGPGNFTATMNNYGEIIGTSRFIQPVHNIYLLIISEIGIIGTILLGLLLYQFRDQILNLNLTKSAPLIALLFIGLLDHYPLTLQTGQLLMALAIGLSLNKHQTQS